MTKFWHMLCGKRLIYVAIARQFKKIVLQVGGHGVDVRSLTDTASSISMGGLPFNFSSRVSMYFRGASRNEGFV